MAILLKNTNTLILLPPKTGSKWLRSVIDVSMIPYELIGPPELSGHGDLSLYGRNYDYIVAFVRHPATWHYSYWWYRSKGPSNWEEKWELDRKCGDSSFKEYISKVTKYCPKYVTHMFECYTGPEDDPIDFIGKLENLRRDIITALTNCGENFDSDLFLEHPVKNKGSNSTLPDKYRNDIYVAEKQAYSRYKYKL